MGTPASSMDPVPESVLKKRKTQEKLAADRAAAAAEAKKANKEKRVAMYKSAEKYVKEYRNMAKQRVRMHRQAKAAGNHYVDGEAKLAFVVRIRGLNDNAVIEKGLGAHGIMCMEDLVHEIYTVGPKFKEANNFLWPFKLRPAKGGQAKKRKGYREGGQAGNREDQMNNLIQKML